MSQLSIFEMHDFYRLTPEDQQRVMDAILNEYRSVSNRTDLEHFVAQYLQLPKRKRDKINTLVMTLYRMNRNYPQRYHEYSASVDYGIAQIKKSPNLFSARFVAYETCTELGLKGKLRFKVDCSSPVTVKQLQDEMNRAFLARVIQRKSTPNVVKVDFRTNQRVSEIQVELLQEMLDTCNAELLVDLCGDDAIKLRNPWNAVMIMKREVATGRTILQGDRTVVQNFSRRVNSFF